MVPIALGLVFGAGSAIKLVERCGTTAVVSAGLLGVGALLGASLLWTFDLPYWPLGLWFFALSVSMGWIMGPATSSVMGAVPEEKSGVASAMNDVTRQVAGALGTAVIGSLIASLYASRIGDAGAGVPDAARVGAEESIGQAQAIASSLPVAEGAQLAESASVAFTDALGIGFTVGAIFALVAAAAVKRWLPSEGTIRRPGVSAPEAVELPAGAVVEGQSA